MRQIMNLVALSGSMLMTHTEVFFSFMRHSKDGKKNLLFVCNFTPIERPEYRVGVPRGKQVPPGTEQ